MAVVEQRVDERYTGPARDADSLFIKLGGHWVHYKHYPPRETYAHRPVVLLLHGFFSSLFTFRNIVPELTALGFDVYAVDRLNFGYSDVVRIKQHGDGVPLSHEAVAAGTLEFMDRLGLRRVLLCAHSMGCLTSVMVALRARDRVCGGILMAPAVFLGGVPQGMTWLLNTRFMKWFGPRFAQLLMSKLEPTMVRSTMHPRNRHLVNQDMLDVYGKMMHEDWAKAWWDACVAVSQYPVTIDEQELGKLRQPFLIIGGTDDNVIPPKDQVKLAAWLPHAELHMLRHCRHVPHEERLDTTMTIIERWLYRHHLVPQLQT